MAGDAGRVPAEYLCRFDNSTGAPVAPSKHNETVTVARNINVRRFCTKHVLAVVLAV